MLNLNIAFENWNHRYEREGLRKQSVQKKSGTTNRRRFANNEVRNLKSGISMHQSICYPFVFCLKKNEKKNKKNKKFAKEPSR